MSRPLKLDNLERRKPHMPVPGIDLFADEKVAYLNTLLDDHGEMRIWLQSQVESPSMNPRNHTWQGVPT